MQIYSPIQFLDLPLFRKKEVKVFIKRDDMIHPFISGNKWRKLKYNLPKLQDLELNKVVTFGGAWSNHLLASACFGAKYGLQVKAFVRGDEVSNSVLRMCKLFGMELCFVDRDLYRNKQALYDQMPNSETYYFIDEGGSGKEGVLGCSEIIAELDEAYDHVFCAAGTGTTAAGLAVGIQQHKLNTKLHVVPVLKGAGFIQHEIVKHAASMDQVSLHMDYHFGGYAKVKPELIEFTKFFISQTGIMIEPTYTGKAMFALYDLISNNYFPQGSKILFLHTGGLTGILGMLDKF